MSDALIEESAPEPAASGRLRSLDGLRGLAALVVVLHHCLLTWPSFAATYVVGSPGATVGSSTWWLTQTPFKLLTAGGEAVTIFFVLSGVVLTLPTLGKPHFDWWGYYPRRLVRLYVPVIAAVLFAGILEWLMPRGASTAQSWWAQQATVRHPSPALLISAMDLLSGNPVVDNPLWSLQWEVLFSLLLPVFIAVAVLSKRRPWIAVLVAGLAVAVGVELGDGSLTYLPVFIGGVAIAVSLPRLEARFARLSFGRASGLVRALVLAASLLALILYWLIRPAVDGQEFLGAELRGLSMFGAVILVVLAALWTPLVRLLTTPVVQWLGRISFSLYLIHVPILAFANTVFGPRLWWVSAACTVVLALGIAEFFTRFIEQPAHRLSRRTGRFFSQLVRA